VQRFADRLRRGVILSLLQEYQASSEFKDLRERTRSDYVGQIKRIELAFADFPLAALSDPRTKAEFRAWRDRLAERSRRQADYAWTVLARVLSRGKGRGLIMENPCERGGRLYRGTRADKIWSEDDEATFNRASPKHLHLPVLMALWTGQRQGDLLRLTWAAYDGETIRLKQSKTGARVVVPVGAPLKAALDALKRRSPVILVTADGKPCSPDGFRASFGEGKGWHLRRDIQRS
jgi:integrase